MDLTTHIDKRLKRRMADGDGRDERRVKLIRHHVANNVCNPVSPSWLPCFLKESSLVGCYFCDESTQLCNNSSWPDTWQRLHAAQPLILGLNCYRQHGTPEVSVWITGGHSNWGCYLEYWSHPQFGHLTGRVFSFLVWASHSVMWSFRDEQKGE